MSTIECLDENHSTTRLLTQEKPEIINNPEDKFTKESKAFETVLFLPEGEGRKGEGGLRTKGYFKKSFEDKPLISIITVVFNGEKFLEETIQSVINQTYDNVEYIIIDGGSTDGTLDIIKKYENRIDYWVSERDRGIYDAWNKAISVSNGEWIGFLGADDFYINSAIENYVLKIAENDNIDYISSKIILCNEQKKLLRIIGNEWKWDSFSRFMNVAHVGSLHNRLLYERVGLYDLDFKICGDYELLLRAKSKLQTTFVNKVLANMRVGGISDSNFKVFKETYDAKIKHNTRKYILLAKIEMYIAILKWKLRKYYHGY